MLLLLPYPKPLWSVPQESPLPPQGWPSAAPTWLRPHRLWGGIVIQSGENLIGGAQRGVSGPEAHPGSSHISGACRSPLHPLQQVSLSCVHWPSGQGSESPREAASDLWLGEGWGGRYLRCGLESPHPTPIPLSPRSSRRPQLPPAQRPMPLTFSTAAKRLVSCLRRSAMWWSHFFMSFLKFSRKFIRGFSTSL